MQTFTMLETQLLLTKLLTPFLMKQIIPFLLAFLFWASGISAQDTVRFTGCVRTWNTLQPVKNTTIITKLTTAGEYNVPTGPDQHCAEVVVPVVGLPANTSVSVSASKDSSGFGDQFANGVSVGDLVRITCHILGTYPLNSAFAMITADANRSGSITTYDILELQKLILGTYQKLPNNTVWRFFPEYYQFPNPANPFAPTTLDLLPLNEFIAKNGDTLGVFGLKTGDLDGDVNLNGAYTSSTQAGDTLQITLPDIQIPANTTVEVPVFLPAIGVPLKGIQMELKTQPGVKIINVIPGQIPFNASTLNFNFPDTTSASNPLRFVALSTMTLNSFQSSRFKLLMTSSQTIALKEVLTVGTGIPALGFSSCDSGFKPYKLLLHFSGTVPTQNPVETGLHTSPVAPNPFTDHATIQLELPETLPVLLEVFDLNGRLIWWQEQTLPGGPQQLEIPAEAVAPGSMALYRIRAGSGVATGKAIRER